MANSDEMRANLQNPERVLTNVRRSYTVDADLISDYLEAGRGLQAETRNPIPSVVFKDTQDVQVVNLADGGHLDDDHFLSLFHPETIDRAVAFGFKDIVLEAGDIPNMTDMFDEYVSVMDMFSNGQETVEISLGDETRTFSALEYQAHIFGVLRGIYSGAGHLDLEESSRTAQALMDTLKYAGSKGIKVHAIGVPMEQANSYVLQWQERYEVAHALHPEELSAEQIEIILGFGGREPIKLLTETMKSIQDDPGAFINTLNPIEHEFVDGALRRAMAERTGGATINGVTAESIQGMIAGRQGQGFTSPRVLHMHGMAHFTGANDIDNILENMGITTTTIGFSGSAQSHDAVSTLFNNTAQNPEFPQKWFIAPTGEYGGISSDSIQAALNISVTTRSLDTLHEGPGVDIPKQ